MDINTTRMERFSKIMTTQKFSRSERSSESSITMKKLTMASTLFRIDQWSNWRTMLDTRVNGSLIKISVKEKDDKSGLTVLCMRAGGWTIRPMAKEGSFMLTEMCMMASGLMTKLTVLVYIAIWMEQNMRGTGKKINNTDKVLRLGLTVPGMKVNTCKAKSMEKASLLGLMAPLTTVNS